MKWLRRMAWYESEPHKKNPNCLALLKFLRWERNSEWTAIWDIPSEVCVWQTACLIAARDESRYRTQVWDGVPYLMCRPSAKAQAKKHFSNQKSSNKAQVQTPSPHSRAHAPKSFPAARYSRPNAAKSSAGKGEDIWRMNEYDVGWGDTEMSKDDTVSSD